MIMTAQIWRTV